MTLNQERRSTKALLKRTVIAIAGSIVLWLAWNYYFPKSVLHYRLDVTFEVDGVPVTGSSVQKLIVYRVRGIGHDKANWHTYGEAVRVDLPGHGAVYVLMTTPTPDGTYTFSTTGRFDFLVSWACKLKEQRGDRSWDDFVRMVGAVTGECDVPKQHLPLMVHFRDELVPSTVERVVPDQMDRYFEGDVRFVSAKISITDAPVWVGIDTHLPWLSEFPEPSLEEGPATSNPPFPQIMKHGYFRKVE